MHVFVSDSLVVPLFIQFMVVFYRESNLCGTFSYVAHESSRTCLQCGCDVRGVIDSNVECNEVKLVLRHIEINTTNHKLMYSWGMTWR